MEPPSILVKHSESPSLKPSTPNFPNNSDETSLFQLPPIPTLEIPDFKNFPPNSESLYILSTSSSPTLPSQQPNNTPQHQRKRAPRTGHRRTKSLTLHQPPIFNIVTEQKLAPSGDIYQWIQKKKSKDDFYLPEDFFDASIHHGALGPNSTNDKLKELNERRKVKFLEPDEKLSRKHFNSSTQSFSRDYSYASRTQQPPSRGRALSNPIHSASESFKKTIESIRNTFPIWKKEPKHLPPPPEPILQQRRPPQNSQQPKPSFQSFDSDTDSVIEHFSEDSEDSCETSTAVASSSATNTPNAPPEPKFSIHQNFDSKVDLLNVGEELTQFFTTEMERCRSSDSVEVYAEESYVPPLGLLLNEIETFFVRKRSISLPR
ncbi:hypothetical protein HK098_007483 [Nowakowskiella sp. JEL0407]|nr:hypothetical protein HK098_007483 [Nowakowskiella sp. JEL0407]